VAAYNIVTATKLSEPGAAAAIEEIEALHLPYLDGIAGRPTSDPGVPGIMDELDNTLRPNPSCRIPGVVQVDGTAIPLTTALATQLAIGDDPEAPPPHDPGYVLYIRRCGTRGSVALYLLVSGIVAAADPGAEVFPGGLKGLRRIVFKSFLNYRGQFSCVKDGIRCTVVLPTIAAVLRTLHAILDAANLVVCRLKNTFARSYDAKPFGGYRDVQLLCIFQVDGRWRFGEVQLNLAEMVTIKGRPNGGHAVFKFARSIEAYNKSVYEYRGVITESLIGHVEAGMVLLVGLVGDRSAPALRDHFYDALFATASRVSQIDLGDSNMDDAACRSLGRAIQSRSSQSLELVVLYDSSATADARTNLRNVCTAQNVQCCWC
jgi:hypothetical protein